MLFKPALILLSAGCLVLAGCNDIQQMSSRERYPAGRSVGIILGAEPGSGPNLTIRSAIEALHKDKIVDVPLIVENPAGAAGAASISTMVEDFRGTDHQLAVTSLSMMINQLRGASEYGYEDVTMIAALTTEYFVVVTSSNSPFKNASDLMAAVKADADRVPVAAEADDQTPFNLLFSAAGGDASTLTYVDFERSEDQIAALRNGTINVAIGYVSEFRTFLENGELWPLAVLSERRLPDLEAPTAIEQGLDVTLASWCGIYGPPGMPDYAVHYWQTALGKMVETQAWDESAQRNRLRTTFMIGNELQNYLSETQEVVERAFAEATR